MFNSRYDQDNARSVKNWAEYLTIQNIASVEHRMTEMLQGCKFAFVAVNAEYPDRIEVRVDCELKSDSVELISLSYDKEKGFAFINTSYNSSNQGGWTMGWSTSRDQYNKKTHKDKTDTYVSFKHDKIETIQYNGYDEKLIWVIQLQEENE